MECLNSALSFGADAVFLAGKMFGMRSASKNFDNTQLKQACELAHAKGAKLYVTCNTLPRNNELDFLPDYLSYAQECGVDAFIIADLGVFEAAKIRSKGCKTYFNTGRRNKLCNRKCTL